MKNDFTPCSYEYERMLDAFNETKKLIDENKDVDPQQVWILLTCVMTSWRHDRSLANFRLKHAEEKPDEELRKLLYTLTSKLKKKFDIYG